MVDKTNISYDRPKNWQDLERLTRSVFSETHGKHFQRHGKGFEPQNGVDIFGYGNANQPIGIQCKGHDTAIDAALSRATIENEVKAAATFTPKIDEFYIVTCSNDRKEYISIANEMSALHDFKVYVIGWQTFEEYLGHCPKARRAHGYESPHSLRRIAALIAVSITIFASAVVGFDLYKRRSDEGSDARKQTVAAISAFTGHIQQLSKNYSSCLQAMERTPFVFSKELNECKSSIGSVYDKISTEIPHSTSYVDPRVLSEFISIQKIIEADYRHIAMTAEVTGFFEEAYFREFRRLCPSSGYGKPDFRPVMDQALRVSNVQAETYFVLRDFGMTTLHSAEARAAILAREVSGLPQDASMIQEANLIKEIIDERNSFKFKESSHPLTRSLMKARSSPDLASFGNIDDLKEESLKGELMLIAPEKIFRGKREWVKELVDCGVFKKDALKDF